MKKTITILLMMLITSMSFSQQLISHSSVRVDESDKKGYLELEEFWSLIQEQAIKDGHAQRWMVWEFLQNEGEDSERNPDFLIMNFYKDSLQKLKANNIDWKDYAKKVYKGKLSKSKFEKKWNLPTGKRNFYELERLDNTYWHGELKAGMEISLFAFKALNEDYEDYEMKFFKKWHEKNILDGSRKWWEFNKVISSNLNTESSTEGTPTHMTIDMYDRERSQEEMDKFWSKLTFEDRMMIKNGLASRELMKTYRLKLLMFK
tara:strand:- start:238 stop:1020 length:783 start_codon:yes stop_codon:yes gene_type:complete